MMTKKAKKKPEKPACAACGATMQVNDNFCSKCGANKFGVRREHLPGQAPRQDASNGPATTYGCHCCQYCGRDMPFDNSGRGDTYCSCREDAMTPEEREAYQRWIDGMERR